MDNPNLCERCLQVGELDGKALYFCSQGRLNSPTLLLVDSDAPGDYASGKKLISFREHDGVFIQVRLMRIVNNILEEVKN